ncbi:hypothetical protein KSS87_005042 [Heliosperma pusillum]|nr:hypothetical protein KSS87_005042 [Heliosperma pusillum]
MKLAAPFFTLILSLICVHFSNSVPFIVLHGIGDQCSNRGISRFTKHLSDWSGSEGYCVGISDASWDSWFMPLEDQTQIVCDKVKKMEELREGYNIVGLSQGNLIGRAVVEFCEGGPPVKNLISLGGPHAGIASVPLCGNMDGYLDKCRFLPKLNNEIPGQRNSTYKKRFSSLENLDKVLVPKETAWFGYYPDGAFTPLLSPQETKLYSEDWIGLKTLDEAGKVKFVSVAGGHLRISDEDKKKYMVPYLQSEDSKINGREIRGVHQAPTVGQNISES